MPAAYALRTLNHAGRILQAGDLIQADFVYHGKSRTTDLQALVDEGSATWERPPHPAAAEVEAARQDQAALELQRAATPPPVADDAPAAAAAQSADQPPAHKPAAHPRRRRTSKKG